MKRIPIADDVFLRLESRRMPLHVGVLLLFRPPEDAPADFTIKLVERLKRSTRCAPPFNRVLVNRRGLNYWAEDNDFDIDQHFVHTTLAPPHRIRELLAFVSRVHGAHLDRSYPLWKSYLIDGLEDRRFALYIKMHHSMMDGISGAKMLLEAMAQTPEASIDLPAMWDVARRKREDVQPIALPTGPSQAFGGLVALRQLVRERSLAMRPLVEELRDAALDFRRGSRDLVLAGQAPKTILNNKVSASRRFAAQGYSAPRMRKVAEAHDATVNDVALAMCGGALRRYLQELGELPERPLVGAVPVSTRKQGDDSYGNQVAFTMTHLATDLDDAGARLRAIKSCMDYSKRRMRRLSTGQLMAYTGVMMASGAVGSLFAKDRALGSVCISHVPGPRRPMYWQGARLDGIYPASLLIDGSALNITLISRDETVDFGIIACRKALPHVQRLLGYLEDELTELERAH